MTAYLHLSRFGPGIRGGARVRQGDIVAYTGATGLATGPHLDYRVKHNDQWLDPLSLKGVRDEPIPPYQLASFRGWRDAVRTSLATGVIPGSFPKAALPRPQLAVRGRVPGGVTTSDTSAVAAGR